jgi:hypothetical protein
MPRANKLTLILLLWAPLPAAAQPAPDLRQIVERLERLERENRALADEVRALRAELAGARAAAEPAAIIPERLEIVERRVEEHAQTKVETTQRFPIRLTGMALFNTFWNSQDNASDYPTVAGPPNRRRAGATLRQTVVGLEYRGPQTVWGGQVHGSVFMDFFAGSTPLNETMRLRTGSIQINWKSRSVLAGLEKPIFNPREPSSIAQVGISPLTGAGNLWLWLPQVRFQQDFHFGRATGLRAQAGVMQTREVDPVYAPSAGFNLDPSRPGFEGRFEWFYNLDDERRVEVAPGFHASTTHVAGGSVGSNLVSVDWLFKPWRPIEFTGAFYSGQNIAHLGTGRVRQSYTVHSDRITPVHSRGGWGQLAIRPFDRWTFHFFSGQMDDRDSDLPAGALGKNLLFGGNIFYNLAPNVTLALEATQLRSRYIRSNVFRNNHYDLALAYRF